MADKQSMIFYYDWMEMLQEFDDAEAFQIVRAILKYAKTGEDTEFEDRSMRIAYKTIRKTVAGDTQKYEEKCAKNRAAALARWGDEPMQTDANACERMPEDAQECEAMPKMPISDNGYLITDNGYLITESDTDNGKLITESETDKKNKNMRVKPSLMELREYAQEAKLTNLDVEEFYDFYQSNGWKVGKNPMKDWRATARNWNRRSRAPDYTPKASGELDWSKL